MAKKRRTKKANNKVLVLAFTVTAAVFLPTTIVCFFGLLPTIAAKFVDRSKNKMKTITVGALNVAGCSPFIVELWTTSHTFDKAFDIVLDPMNIIIIYTAAGFGYMIDWSMSGIVASIMYRHGQLRQKAIKARQAQLVERWGEEVTGELEVDDLGFPLEVVDSEISS